MFSSLLRAIILFDYDQTYQKIVDNQRHGETEYDKNDDGDNFHVFRHLTSMLTQTCVIEFTHRHCRDFEK